MKTRYKRYIDYGLTDRRVKEIMDYCTNVKDINLIVKAARSANPAISESLVESLTEGLSYSKASQRRYIMYCGNDFYAYKRLTVAILNNLLLEENRG